jgi:hypothetical protein
MKCERCGEVNPAAIHTCTPRQEPEPVAWQCAECGGTHSLCLENRKDIPLYTAPPPREWQGLTDEEILEEYRQSYGDDGNLTDVYFARAIEAKLKEKNAPDL